MKSIKPLVLGIVVALNAGPLRAQNAQISTDNVRAPSILESTRAARKKPKEESPAEQNAKAVQAISPDLIEPKPIKSGEVEPSSPTPAPVLPVAQIPAAGILQTRTPESIAASRERLEKPRYVQSGGQGSDNAQQAPRQFTIPNILGSRRAAPRADQGAAVQPMPVAPAVPSAPAAVVAPVVVPPAASQSAPQPAAPVAAVPVLPATPAETVPAVAVQEAAPVQTVQAPVAPTVPTPSILEGQSGRVVRKAAPVARAEEPTVPLREAQALSVPDVNIPLIGFREKYSVVEEQAPVTETPAAPVAEPGVAQPAPLVEPVIAAQPEAAPTAAPTEPAPVVEAPVEAAPLQPAPIQPPPVAFVPAGNLVEVFARAKGNSPTYRSAEATRDANLTESTIAKLAFLPTATLALTQSELENSTRKVARVGVPLFSLAALASYKGADPLEIQAYANFRVQENLLATEVFRVTSNLVRANEQERLNQANIDTLQQQVRFADQAYKEGQGTITDLRDTQVRLNQALAARIAAVSQRVNAEQEYRNLVGEPPSRKTLQMTTGFKDIQVDSYDSYLQRALAGNPNYIASTQALRLSELSVLRSRGAISPTVGLSYVASERNGVRIDNAGVAVTIPFGVQDYLGVSVAKDKHRAQVETYRGIEQNLRLMVQQLQSLSASGRIEVAVRTDAINAAELSVQANQKSYLGGVRTQIEVLNSIQTLFDTQLQQITARLTLAQNVLKLELESGSEPADALMKVQNLLF